MARDSNVWGDPYQQIETAFANLARQDESYLDDPDAYTKKDIKSRSTVSDEYDPEEHIRSGTRRSLEEMPDRERSLLIESYEGDASLEEKDVEEQIDDLSKILTSGVLNSIKSGIFEDAEATFRNIRERAEERGVEHDDIDALFEAYRHGYEKLRNDT